MLVCSRCKVEKTVSEFYREPRRRSGYFGQCKPCCRQRTKFYKRLHSSPEVRAQAEANRVAREAARLAAQPRRGDAVIQAWLCRA